MIILHTSHDSDRPPMKVSICATDLIIKHHQFLQVTSWQDKAFHMSITNLIEITLMVKQWAPDFPPQYWCVMCDAYVWGVSAQTPDRMQQAGVRGRRGMQQMTAMQISEINCITGSVCCFEGASWMQILPCKDTPRDFFLRISIFMVPLFNAPNPILMGHNSTQMTSLSGPWIQSPLELI